MDRIIKEIRSGTVDYEEYYNQSENFQGLETNETYGQNYCQYSRQFYSAGPDKKYGTYDDESTGLRKEGSKAPIKDLIQSKLYLIDTSGTQRTYVQRVEIQKMDSSDPPQPIGKPIGKVAILKLVGKDYGINHLPKGENRPNCADSGEGDGLIDTWVCDSGFKCAKKRVTSFVESQTGPVDCSEVLETPFDYPGTLDDVDPDVCETETCYASATQGKSSFVDITPETIDVVSLDFIVTPMDDPRKAYNQTEIQIQPNVTLKMVTRAAPKIASTFTGNTPTIILESTVSARAAKEIITECNLQECIAEMAKPCPKHTGILEFSVQTCSQGVWPGCSEEDYKRDSMNYLKNNGDLALAEARVVELGIRGSNADGTLTPQEMTDILSDGLDHNAAFGAAGRTFYEIGSEVGSCFTTENGVDVPDEGCKRRRCTDGVDNDVNDKIDSEDPACLYYLCNNGFRDPGEDCTDVGGICFMRPKTLPKGTESNCTDGYDNDCNYDISLVWDDFTDAQKEKAQLRGMGPNSSLEELNIARGQGADEYDQSCIDHVFCDNGKLDPVEPNTFGPKDYGTPWYIKEKTESDDLKEECVDIGGLCEWTSDGFNRKVEKGKEYDPTQALDLNEPVDSLNNKFLSLIRSGSLCYDNLDNDCDYEPFNPKSGPDEFDPKCKAAICGNGGRNCQLAVPPATDSLTDTFNFVAYMKDYDTRLCGVDGECCSPLYASPLNEACKDVGGICTPEGKDMESDLPLENSNTTLCIKGDPDLNCMCFDGIDNDCGGDEANGNGIDGVIDTDIIIFSPNPRPGTKMADKNCCPDNDVDGYAPSIPKSCEPVGAEVGKSNGIGFIDCNDDPSKDDLAWNCPSSTSGCTTDTAKCAVCRFPQAPELCGDGVDSNCSGSNIGDTDDGSDNVELSCCEDNDGDGFGIEPANLPNRSVSPNRCLGPDSPIDFSERTRYDCNDNETSIPGVIYPGAPENTKALCTDFSSDGKQLNNSCRFVKDLVTGKLDIGKPRANHIDMYAVGAKDAAKTLLLAASANEQYNPDCCPSTGVGLGNFYGTNSAAAHHPGMEICDDANSLLAGGLLGSDENCNGLEGYDDAYCMGNDELSFFHSFDKETYIINGADGDEPGVRVKIAGGRIQLETAVAAEDNPTIGDVTSTTMPLAPTCNRVSGVELSATANLPSGITYFVSNGAVDGDGKTIWSSIDSGGAKIMFGGGTNNLRWKATLERATPADESPTLNDVTLKWTCG